MFGYAVAGQDNLGLMKVRPESAGHGSAALAHCACASQRIACCSCLCAADLLLLLCCCLHARSLLQVGDKIKYIKVLDGAENLVNA